MSALDLFTPLQAGDLTLPNRIIMAPMTRSRADDAGIPHEKTPIYYRQRASAGLILSEAINVSAMAKGYPRTPGLWTDEQVQGWRKVTDTVHQAGGRIFAQLFHTGRIALPDFLPDHAQPVAPSAIAAQGQGYTLTGMKPYVTPRALETEEIPGIIAEFVNATRRALEAGFDGVELHAASGYIVQQFLTTNANARTDSYGGSMENRARFLLETIDGMIGAAGAHRTGIKLSPQMPFNDVQGRRCGRTVSLSGSRPVRERIGAPSRRQIQCCRLAQPASPAVFRCLLRRRGAGPRQRECAPRGRQSGRGGFRRAVFLPTRICPNDSGKTRRSTRRTRPRSTRPAWKGI